MGADPNKVSKFKTTSDCKWCVTEKVHGANFSILYNGKDFVAAKRTGSLDSECRFYSGWQQVVEYETAHIIKAYNLLKTKYTQQTQKQNTFKRAFCTVQNFIFMHLIFE